MHTDPTLELLDSTTIRLGQQFHHFTNKTCPAFKTKELKREVQARQHRQAKQQSEQEPGVVRKAKDTARQNKDTGPLRKQFHLGFIKYHFLDDVADQIREFGTTDSYTTEPVSTEYASLPLENVHSHNLDKGELEHRTSKARYPRTSRKAFVKQMADIERRQARIRNIRSCIDPARAAQTEIVANDPEQQFHIGASQNVSEDIGEFVRKRAGDPAVKVPSQLWCTEIMFALISSQCRIFK